MPEEVLPEGALDIQHDTDPEPDHAAARHIPHLGHCLLLFVLTVLLFQISTVVLALAYGLRTSEQLVAHPGVLFTGQVLSFLLTLVVAVPLFSRIWQRPFPQGIQWKARALRRYGYWVVPAGIASSLLATFAQRFVHHEPDNPLSRLMHTPVGAWSLLLYGVLLAPLVEEIFFRGFLLPALATAYDWLLLERTPAALQRWQSSASHSRAALAFGLVFSNIPFALLHSGQLSHVWGAIAIIYGVGVALTLARILTRSTACSVLMHMAHNGTVFAFVLWSTGGFRHLDKL